MYRTNFFELAVCNFELCYFGIHWRRIVTKIGSILSSFFCLESSSCLKLLNFSQPEEIQHKIRQTKKWIALFLKKFSWNYCYVVRVKRYIFSSKKNWQGIFSISCYIILSQHSCCCQIRLKFRPHFFKSSRTSALKTCLQSNPFIHKDILRPSKQIYHTLSLCLLTGFPRFEFHLHEEKLTKWNWLACRRLVPSVLHVFITSERTDQSGHSKKLHLNDFEDNKISIQNK